jgi:hypothetical protein
MQKNITDIELSCTNLITVSGIKYERNERNSSLGSGVSNSAYCSFFKRHEYYYWRHQEWELIIISSGTTNECKRYNSREKQKKRPSHVLILINVYCWKVKQSNYRSGTVLWVPRGWGSQISRQWVNEGGKIVSPTHRPPLPARKYTWYSFLLEAESTPGP